MIWRNKDFMQYLDLDGSIFRQNTSFVFFLFQEGGKGFLMILNEPLVISSVLFLKPEEIYNLNVVGKMQIRCSSIAVHNQKKYILR